jgi:hypothetical protein
MLLSMTGMAGADVATGAASVVGTASVVSLGTLATSVVDSFAVVVDALELAVDSLADAVDSWAGAVDSSADVADSLADVADSSAEDDSSTRDWARGSSENVVVGRALSAMGIVVTPGPAVLLSSTLSAGACTVSIRVTGGLA